MRFLFAAGLLITLAQPAFACHHYHTWRYQFPQRCGVATRVVAQPDRTWFVEIAPPAIDDDTARQRGIEELERRLGAITLTRDPP